MPGYPLRWRYAFPFASDQARYPFVVRHCVQVIEIARYCEQQLAHLRIQKIQPGHFPLSLSTFNMVGRIVDVLAGVERFVREGFPV